MTEGLIVGPSGDVRGNFEAELVRKVLEARH